MFDAETTKYIKFRARVKNWLPALQTLDGTDFSKDTAEVQRMKPEVDQSKPSALQRFVSA